MAGITETGFVKKTLAEIKVEWEDAIRAAFGNSVNLQAPSRFATLIGIAADRESLVWDLAEDTWNSRSRSGALGVSLDNVGELTNTERLAATKSQVLSQIFFGDAGTLIDTTTVLSVSGNPAARFKLDSPVLLEAGTDAVQHIAFSGTPASGTWTLSYGGFTTSALAFNANAAAVQAALLLLPGLTGVTVAGNYAAGFDVTFGGAAGKQVQALLTSSDTLQTSAPAAITLTHTTTTPGVPQGSGKMVAETEGPTVALSGSLTVIETPVAGLNSTKNIVDAILGTLVESDADYRIRQVDELSKSGASTIESIRARMKEEVADVEEAIIFENATDAVDGDGRPPHSIEAFVDGGLDQDILDQLWETKPAGIQTVGDITGSVVDSQGLTQTVKFSRPTEINIYLIVDIVSGDEFPDSGAADILVAILAYGDSLKIGQDVLVYPKLLPAIVDNVAGIDDVTIRIGLAPAPTLDNNIVIAVNERAKFASVRITLNIT